MRTVTLITLALMLSGTAREAPLLFRDTFDSSSPDLNGDLGHRQTGKLAPAHYSLRPGVWFQSPPAAPETVRVAEGHLELRGFTAVRLDSPFGPDPSGAWHLSARLDPVVGDDQSLGWVSLILTPVRDSLGWVLEPTNLLGLLVRSNGEVNVAAFGESRPLHWVPGPPRPASTYAVSLTMRRAHGQVALEGRVNEATFNTVLVEGPRADVPNAMNLVVGAHFHPGDVHLSWLDDLELGGSALP
jgi:hypothetical protein